MNKLTIIAWKFDQRAGDGGKSKKIKNKQFEESYLTQSDADTIIDVTSRVMYSITWII